MRTVLRSPITASVSTSGGREALGLKFIRTTSIRVKAYIDRSLANGSAYELEMRLRDGDGTYRWFLVRYNPLRDDQGQIVRWYVACTDIDDRKRAEERLQQENVALREEVDKASMFEEIVGALARADGRPVASVQGRQQRFDGADHRRDRHRQGTRRAGDSSTVTACLTSVRGRELCGYSARLDCLGALRS